MTTTPIQLRFNDIDIQGHMYNGQYQHIFDLGKSDYFSQVMKLGSMNGAEALITASTATNFYHPVTWGDRVVIRTWVERMGNKSFTVFQQLVDLTTNTVKADCRTVLVAYNALTKETFPLPESWRARIAAAGD